MSGQNQPDSPECAEWIEGNAGWYGAPYQGRATASGERFDRGAFTAAHRTLPFGSEVTLLNPSTDAAVTVRITDRGPFSGDLMIELSQAAAEALDILPDTQASVMLCTDVADEEERLLQVSSFSREKSARDTRDRLRDEGYSAQVIHEQDLYRVIVEISRAGRMNEVRAELEELGYRGAFPYTRPR